MAMSYTYRDPYLMGLVSQQNEDDAALSIGGMGSFTDIQLENLVPIRAYILCCIDNVKAPDDIFSVKKGFYEKELKLALELAKSVPVAGVQQSLFSMSIERA